MKTLLAGIAAAVFLLSVLAPTALATIPTNSDVVITCGASYTPCPTTSFPINMTTTISFCMSNGVSGVIWNTNSGHGTSGLEVKSPGTVLPLNPYGATTAWTYTPAAFATIPACGSGHYTVVFGNGASGWAKLSGPTVPSSYEGGTYTIDLNYKQSNSLTHQTAFFDATTTVPTPEFALPVIAVAATSLLGLALLRKKFVKLPA